MRRTLATLGVVVLLLIIAAAWLAFRATQVRSALTTAQPLVAQLQSQIQRGDVQAANATLPKLEQQTSKARSAVDDPIWRLAAALPGPGDNLKAVRTAAIAVDDVTEGALKPLVGVADVLNPANLKPRNGTIDLGKIAKAAPTIKRANDVVQKAKAQVDAIDTTALIPQVRDAVLQLRTKLNSAAALTATGERATALLPSLLGMSKPHTYLLLFQNSAEARSTGGIPGAYAIVTTDKGKIELTGQGSTADFKHFPESVVPLTPDQLALHSDRIGTFFQDVNLTPDFPVAAQIAREMYRRNTGVTVDAVAATDPVALAYMLNGTGPITLPTGDKVTADNAVNLLLSQVYARFTNPKIQDAFFAATAKAVFDALATGQGDTGKAVQELVKAAGEHRVLLWSADPGEQALIAQTELSGTLPGKGQPTIGVYFNDGTGSKMDYYARRTVTAKPGACRKDGLNAWTVSIDLTSTAPATHLPDYVTGGGMIVPRGTTRTIVLVYAPVGGFFGAATADGQPAGLGSYREEGRSVAKLSADIPAGQTRTMTIDVLLPKGQKGQPGLVITPGVVDTKSHVGLSGCVKT